MAIQPQSSFLGIAKELRLEIYETLLTTDLRREVISHWQDEFTSNGFHTMAVRKDRLRIPWISLMLTCKTISREIGSLIASNADLRTWTLDLQPSKSSTRLGSLIWYQISCPPRDVQTITATLRVQRDLMIRFWGDGGPHAITRSLYQTLNHLTHCGPRMDAQRELEKPIHVKDLIVRIEMIERPKEDEELDDEFVCPDGYAQKRNFGEMSRFLKMIAAEGMTFGVVDQFTLKMNEREEVIESRDTGSWVMPKEWERYGFDWGMETYQTSAGQA